MALQTSHSISGFAIDARENAKFGTEAGRDVFILIVLCKVPKQIKDDSM